MLKDSQVYYYNWWFTLKIEFQLCCINFKHVK